MDTVLKKKNLLYDENPRKARNIVLLLAASLTLWITGYGIVMPVMAKRLQELGAGVDVLGYMTMAFAVGQFVLSPFMGFLADRYGRKPLILVALAGTALTNVALLVAQTAFLYVLIRLVQGAIGAGLLPASMGVVGDIFPEEKRGRWTGILMGSYGLGFILGPGVGGILYDSFGFVAPFAISAVLATLGFILALIVVPETRTKEERRIKAVNTETGSKSKGALPRPLYIFGTLLLLDFVAVFLFSFIEPQLAFYLYEDLRFSTTQFGLLVSFYGLAMVIGQVGLGQLSDKFGRMPLIVVGFILTSSFYFGLVLVQDFFLLIVASVIAGFGSALVVPALSAAYLDITSEQHRARIMGFKESAAALGSAIGPLLVAILSNSMNPISIFAISAVLALVSAAIALLVLKGLRQARVEEPEPKPQLEPELAA
jgi:DHA1 family tetracycline resistance protein-like MFS transporter